MKKKSSLNNQSFVIKDIKTANKSNQNFYHKNSFSDSELEKAINSILTGEAAVDPKQLTILSSILGRKLKQEKLDTRAYNIKFISFNDLQTIELMEAGLRLDFFPGDSLKSHATINKDNGDQWLFERLKKAIEKKDYSSFPFTSHISEDIRTRYLLRTDATDSYTNIMAEILKVKSNFISAEDWEVLTEAMKKSEARLAKEEVLFLEPLPEGGVMGKLKELNDKDREKHQLPEGYKYVDVRSDYHDLVTLKELLFCMSGNLVDHLSIFAGAFSKYIPELNKLGYRGVVCSVEKSKLKSIKLAPIGKEPILFGPIEAAIALSQTFGQEGQIVASGKKYYVTVNGYVAGPHDNKNFAYDVLFPMNDDIVPASETFLFQSDGTEKGVMTTRLYFYAHSPKKLNIFHQQMTVVIGSSDQMFNSCANDSERKHYSKETQKEFDEKMSHWGYDNEPGVKAAKNNYLDEDTPPGVIAVDQKYYEIGRLCSDSVFGENKFTYEKYLKVYGNMAEQKDLIKVVEDQGLLANCLPLTSRFVVYNYLAVKNGGLTRDAQLTTFRKLKRYNFREMVEGWSMDIRLNEKSSKLLDLLHKNVPLSDAFAESFDEDEQEYMKNGTLPSEKKKK